jgi:hypothetical protein
MLAEEGPSLNVEVSLITLKLKERIVAYLENQYRKTGTNDAVSWRGIWIESGATEEEFRKALNAAAETGIGEEPGAWHNNLINLEIRSSIID